ncbi:hypothetical protein [Streptomyces tagetis]|uniref:Uncharacterized protein n=1 Tax=Streptomyces tagetis TaxID=2820809 RepID=A0A940XI99_9ACTN|nr:hypothetical protein [Streptomyces sp. RG38]MBQ0827672.1 hypothetical protein [Streptomyces sp. RG38]
MIALLAYAVVTLVGLVMLAFVAADTWQTVRNLTARQRHEPAAGAEQDGAGAS